MLPHSGVNPGDSEHGRGRRPTLQPAFLYVTCTALGTEGGLAESVQVHWCRVFCPHYVSRHTRAWRCQQPRGQLPSSSFRAHPLHPQPPSARRGAVTRSLLHPTASKSLSSISLQCLSCGFFLLDSPLGILFLLPTCQCGLHASPHLPSFSDKNSSAAHVRYQSEVLESQLSQRPGPPLQGAS